MKKAFLILLTCIALFKLQTIQAQNIAINSTGAKPDNSAMLDVQSTSKGMLVPRMSSDQRAAIASPATGLLVFDNVTNSFWFKNASGWIELVDSANNIWTKTGSNVYVNNGENVGIGISSPDVKFQVDNGTDISASSGGYLQLGATSNSNLAFDNNEIQARNNSSAADLSIQASGGNVGIGTKAPDVKLQVDNGTDVSASDGGYLQLGATSNYNIAFDNNEIQARNNNAASDLYMQVNGGNIGIGTANPAVRLEIDRGTDLDGVGGGYLQLGSAPNANLAFDNNEIQARKSTIVSSLYLQNYGGDIQVGSTSGSTTSDVHINNGKLVKTETGSANMMPLCYGHVSANGTLLSGTSNVTITKGANTAQYFVNCTGITASTMMMAISNKVNDPAKISVAYYSAGQAKVVIENFSETDNEFSFIFYNP